MFITHDCVLMNVAYRNFRDMNSKHLTGCIKHGIFSLVLQKIMFIVSGISTHHTLCSILFLFLQTQGENYLHIFINITSNIWPQKISSPTSIIIKVKHTCVKDGGKTKLLKWVINRMIRLTRNIQMFRRIIIRSAMKNYLQ